MKIAICDDDKTCRDVIASYLNDIKEVRITEFSSGEELVQAYKFGSTFDIIFLDIQMDEITGIEAAKYIRKTDEKVLIFVTTLFDEYVQDAFVINAFQFLKKPIKKDFFIQEFTRAKERFYCNNFKIQINKHGKVILLKAQDVLYIETYGRRLRAVTVKEKYEYIGKLSEEEKRLLAYNFVRCHKSYLLNLNSIKNFEKNDAILDSGEKIPVSREKIAEIIIKTGIFMAGKIR